MNKLMYVIRNMTSRSLVSFCLTFALMMLSTTAFAQGSYSIKGKVVSATNKSSIVGATIVIEGTQNGTISDIDGNFTIKSAKPNGTLAVSYLGFKQSMVPFSQAKDFYNISMIEDVQVISDVVVVGYGQMRKKEVTGSVARVSTEEISKISTSDLGTALQGLVAGVNVQASSGEPGANSNIQIRGLSSISGSSDPLYVVDGVPYESDPGLSSNEIETIDILKDAASAAIYGTRGAGGVILITTKQGKAGQAKVSVDAYYGVQNITSQVDLMNAAEKTMISMLSDRVTDGDNAADNTAWVSLKQYAVNFFNDSDLYDVIINDMAPIQNYAVNVNGGNKGLTYNFAASYYSQEGVIINSKFDRYNIRSNVNFKRDKWTVNTSLGIVLVNQESPGWGLLQQSYRNAPTQSQVDPNASITSVAGEDSELSNFSNILSTIKQTNDVLNNKLTGNFFVGYDIMEGLNVSTRLGIGYENKWTEAVYPLFVLYDEDGELVKNTSYTPMVQETYAVNTSLTWETMLNWNKKFGKHDFKFTGVFSAETYTYDQFYAKVEDLYTAEITSLNAGSGDKQVGTGTGQWGQDRVSSLVGMLGRLQYSYQSKYMASASIRRDGSSRFTESNRWGMFPSVSAGWNVSEESFWQNYKDVVNALKLRLSYGTTGNQSFADYAYSSAVYNHYDYTFSKDDDENLGLGMTQIDFSNPDVVWEVTKQLNAGVDMSFLSSKLNLSLDFYKSNKTDMLFPMVVPPSNGAGESSTVILNAGNMQNKGVELAIGHRNNIKKLSYNMNLTFSRNVNEITEMAGENDMYYFADGKPANTNDKVTVIKPGYEAGAFFVMPTNGIINTSQKLAEYQRYKASAKMGDLMYVDQNEDGVIDDNDRVYGGSGTPDFEIGFNVSAYYKNFDLSMNWYASIGNEVINGTKIYTYNYGTNAELLYMWTATNPTSSIPTHQGTSHDNYRAYADIWVEDGSFLRLKNISVGYSLPKKVISRIGVTKCRFYVAADNLLTFTGYTGYDPEVGSNGLSRRGLDFSTYPVSSQIRGGCQIQF